MAFLSTPKQIIHRNTENVGVIARSLMLSQQSFRANLLLEETRRCAHWFSISYSIRISKKKKKKKKN